MDIREFASLLQNIFGNRAQISVPDWSDDSYGGRDRILILTDKQVTAVLPGKYFGRICVTNTVDSTLTGLGVTLVLKSWLKRQSILLVGNRKFLLQVFRNKSGFRWTFNATEF